MRARFRQILQWCYPAKFDLFGQYFLAIKREWWAIAWGESLLAVVFVLWWSIKTAPMSPLILALFFGGALLIATYFAWRADHIRLIPRLRLSDPPFCFHSATTSNPNERRKYLQIIPECMTEESVEGCEGHLLRIMKWTADAWETTEFDHGGLGLRWSFYDNAKPQILIPGIEKRLNLFWINNRFEIALEIVPQVYAIQTLLNSGNTFRFDIRITGKNSAPVDLQLKVRFGITAGQPIQWDALEVERLSGADYEPIAGGLAYSEHMGEGVESAEEEEEQRIGAY
jgi:hypothetical protein